MKIVITKAELQIAMMAAAEQFRRVQLDPNATAGQKVTAMANADAYEFVARCCHNKAATVEIVE